MGPSGKQRELFDVSQAFPEGFVYQPEFISAGDEARLIAIVGGLALEEATYKEYTAKRRTVSYGGQYDFSRNKLDAAPDIPPLLLPLRERIAQWVGVASDAFVQCLVSEYRPGTPLGWHRDVPNFEVIVGVSLGGTARMRLRPYHAGERNRREDVIALELESRSAYFIRDGARWGWQHSVSSTKELRYSITFRTARQVNA